MILAGRAAATLVVTEVMYDPGSGEPEWEWVEVHNPTATPIDLNGYFVDRVGDAAYATRPTPQIRSLVRVDNFTTTNPTVVPAGGVAVLYNGEGLGYDPARFRAAWPQTPAAAPLIGVAGWAGNALANNPSAVVPVTINEELTFGFWANESAYRQDVADFGTLAEPDRRVAGVAGASFSFAYDDDLPWPESDASASLAFGGSGPIDDGFGWNLSTAGLDGAYPSTPTFLPGEPLNGPDRGSPGAVPGGTPPPASGAGPSLLFTELMYNPASITGVVEWEWIEVYNHGATAIDFAATPMWLDDDDGKPEDFPNLFAGRIEPGEAAVLYNADAATEPQMRDAWDAWGGLNLIGVSDWPTLANGGDLVGLWDDPNAYDDDHAAGTLAGAVVGLEYDNASPWPGDNGADAIYLRNLSFGMTIPTAWSRSSGGSTADPNAFRAAEVLDPLGAPDNRGGDVGSPGDYPFATSPGPAGDYNGDGTVDGADYTRWRDGGPLANETASPGVVDGADYAAWVAAFGVPASVAAASAPTPEPGSLLSALVGSVFLCSRRCNRAALRV